MLPVLIEYDTKRDVEHAANEQKAQTDKRKDWLVQFLIAIAAIIIGIIIGFLIPK